MKPNTSEAVEISKRITLGYEAVATMLPYFGKHIGATEASCKADGSQVSQADLYISENLLGKLKASFPKDELCSEELQKPHDKFQLQGDFAWMLDPIDGTDNYINNIPFCGISLALLHKGHPIYGYIYEHAGQRILHGGPQHPLRQNAELACVQKLPAEPSFISMLFPLRPEHHRALSPLLEKARVRSYGSVAVHLAYNALGLLHGSIGFKTKIWDIAAGLPILASVGAQLRPLQSSYFPLQSFDTENAAAPFCAGSPAFCENIQKCLELDAPIT